VGCNLCAKNTHLNSNASGKRPIFNGTPPFATNIDFQKHRGFKYAFFSRSAAGLIIKFVAGSHLIASWRAAIEQERNFANLSNLFFLFAILFYDLF
jgi:hypothetical protein